MRFRAIFFLIFIGPSMSYAADADVSSRSVEHVDHTSAFLAPTVELGAKAGGFGASAGFWRRKDSSGQRQGYDTFGQLVKALVIDHNGRPEGGLFFYGLDIGGGEWEWFPMSLEIAVGSAYSSNTSSLGVFEVGVFGGTLSTLQIGVVSYTPLATSNKPDWFPDWTVMIRYPISLWTGNKEKVVETRTKL